MGGEMRGKRVKQLRKEFYPFYASLFRQYGRRLRPYKSLFRLFKEQYMRSL